MSERTPMGKVQELYDTRVRSMTPMERLQLARLILDRLTHLDVLHDVSDEWGENDLIELAAYAARQIDPSDGDPPRNITVQP